MEMPGTGMDTERSDVVGLIDGFQLLEGIDLSDVLLPAWPDLDSVVLFAVDQRNLLPVSFLSAGGIIDVLNILG